MEFAWEMADQDGFDYRAISVNGSPDNGRHIEHDEESPPPMEAL